MSINTPIKMYDKLLESFMQLNPVEKVSVLGFIQGIMAQKVIYPPSDAKQPA